MQFGNNFELHMRHDAAECINRDCLCGHKSGGGRKRDAANHSGRGKSIKSEPAVGYGRGNQVLMYGWKCSTTPHTNEMWSDL